jgi:DNA ligase-4
MLELSESSKDFARLKNWRDPNKHSQGGAVAAGEFTDILFDVINRRINTAPSTKTVGEVNDLLDRLVRAADKDQRATIFKEIFHDFSAMEQKWIVRVILREMKTGVGHAGLLKWLHPDAEQCFSTCCDLRRTCHALTEPILLKAMGQGVAVGQPFTPMLAQHNHGHGASGQLQVVVVCLLQGQRRVP